MIKQYIAINLEDYSQSLFKLPDEKREKNEFLRDIKDDELKYEIKEYSLDQVLILDFSSWMPIENHSIYSMYPPKYKQIMLKVYLALQPHLRMSEQAIFHKLLVAKRLDLINLKLEEVLDSDSYYQNQKLIDDSIDLDAIIRVCK